MRRNEPVRLGHATDAAHSSYFVGKVPRAVWRQPRAELGLLGRKVYHAVWGEEIPRIQQIYPNRAYSWVLALPLWKHGLAFPAGLAIPLGLPGLLLTMRRRQPVFLAPVVFLGTWALGLIVFITIARYRMPIIPLLRVFAAAFVGHVSTAAARRRRGGAGKALGLAALLPIVCNLRVGPMPTRDDADTHDALGTHHLGAGTPAAAAAQFRESLALRPDYYDSGRGRATALWRLGGVAPARAAVERALALGRDPESLALAAEVFAATGDRERAEGLRRLLATPRATHVMPHAPGGQQRRAVDPRRDPERGWDAGDRSARRSGACPARAPVLLLLGHDDDGTCSGPRHRHRGPPHERPSGQVGDQPGGGRGACLGAPPTGRR